MSVKRATVALGILGAAAGWTGSAHAALCPGVLAAGVVACYDVTDAGINIPYTSVNPSSTANGAGTVHNYAPGVAALGHTGTDEIDIYIDGPIGVTSPGGGGTSSLKSFAIRLPVRENSGFKSLSYQFTDVTGPVTGLIDSGPLSVSGTTQPIQLDFTATGTAGAPYSFYRLLISWATETAASLAAAGHPNSTLYTGGGYSYSLQIDPCNSAIRSCENGTVPVPPAAILFVSGLAGLGLLGRKRRKRAQA